VGDPIELAALKGVEWRWDALSHTALPGSWNTLVKALKVVNTTITQAQAAPEAQRPPKAFIDGLYEKSAALEKKIQEAKDKARSAMFAAVQVVHRHHFASGLQRMSVVCRCVPQGSAAASASVVVDKSNPQAHYSPDEQWYCLVKGSPEALKPLLVAHSAPAWYTATYEALARKGLRVLALAYKKVSAEDLGLSAPSNPLHRG
jgi:cation-transporting ATPase 13A1